MNIIRQAIVTKYISPTNTRGARIKAKAAAGSVTMPYDHRLNTERNHAKAAHMLAAKYRWHGDWYGGGLPDQNYVWTCVDSFDQTPAFAIVREG